MTEASLLVKQLGARLREARQRVNLTVREAAERVGVDHSMIVRYENSESLPPLDRLVQLAAIYDLTPAALLAQHDPAVLLIAALDRADASVLAKLNALLLEE